MAYSLRDGRSGNRIPFEVIFSAPVQTGPGAHPAPIQLVPGLSLPGPGSGVNHPSPSSVEVKERVELHLYSSSGPLRPVLG
jgi:hypothetical protein